MVYKGDIKSIETSGDSFEKTKLFQPKTWFQKSVNVTGSDMDVEGGEGYTKNTKRKFFGIGGK